MASRAHVTYSGLMLLPPASCAAGYMPFVRGTSRPWRRTRCRYSLDVAAVHAASASGVRSRGASRSDTWAASRTCTTPRSWSSRLGSTAFSQLSFEAVLEGAVVKEDENAEEEEEAAAVVVAAVVVVVVVVAAAAAAAAAAACVVVVGVCASVGACGNRFRRGPVFA